MQLAEVMVPMAEGNHVGPEIHQPQNVRLYEDVAQRSDHPINFAHPGLSVALQYSYLLTLPLFTSVAILSNMLILCVFSFEKFKKYRASVFFRFVGIMDICQGILLFGLLWAVLLIPDAHCSPQSLDSHCRTYTILRYTFQDLSAWGVVCLVLDRCDAVTDRTDPPFFVVTMLRRQQIVRHAPAKILLVLMSLLTFGANVAMVETSEPEVHITSMYECFNSWKEDTDFSFRSVAMAHAVISMILPSFIIFVAYLCLRFSLPPDQRTGCGSIRRTQRLNPEDGKGAGEAESAEQAAGRPSQLFKRFFGRAVNRPADRRACRRARSACDNSHLFPDAATGMHCSSTHHLMHFPTNPNCVITNTNNNFELTATTNNNNNFEPTATHNNNNNFEPTATHNNNNSVPLSEAMSQNMTPSANDVGMTQSQSSTVARRLCGKRVIVPSQHLERLFTFMSVKRNEVQLMSMVMVRDPHLSCLPSRYMSRNLTAMAMTHGLFFVLFVQPQIAYMISGCLLGEEDDWRLMKNFGLAVDLVFNNRINFTLFLYIIVSGHAIARTLLRCINVLSRLFCPCFNSPRRQSSTLTSVTTPSSSRTTSDTATLPQDASSARLIPPPLPPPPRAYVPTARSKVRAVTLRNIRLRDDPTAGEVQGCGQGDNADSFQMREHGQAIEGQTTGQGEGEGRQADSTAVFRV